MQSLSSITLADPKVIQNPYEYYARLRAEDPVHFDEGIKTWLITRHEDIVTVARNIEDYSDEMRVSEAVSSPFKAEADAYMREQGFAMLGPRDGFKVDGALHTRRRKLVAPTFSGSAVAAMESKVANICRERMTALLARSEVDLFKDYALPIPIMVICDALGLSMDHIDEISAGADSMVARIGAGATREVAFQHARNLLQLQKFVKQALDAKRIKPGNDLISLLIQARIDDPASPQLTETELLSISTVAIAGGVDTTRNSIAFGLHALATQPSLLARLRAAEQQDKEIGRFAEEVMRYYSAVPALPRIAKREVVLNGKTIPEGAPILLCWASGNRDSARFTDPDVFNIDRTNTNQHLAFGVGIHFCVGAMLARQEMKCAYKEIINSVDSLELAVSPEQLDMSPSMVIMRGMKSLPVRLHKRAA